MVRPERARFVAERWRAERGLQRNGHDRVVESRGQGGRWTTENHHLCRAPRTVAVRELHRRPRAAAKQSEGRRCHALCDRVHRGEVLWEAWERVRADRGAAGVDRVTRAAVEDLGVCRILGELQRDLRAIGIRDLRLLIEELDPIADAWLHQPGLHRLVGTVRGPKAA